MKYKVLFAIEREMEISGNNINEIWEKAEIEKSDDEIIVAVKLIR